LHLLCVHILEADRTNSLDYGFPGEQLVQEGLVSSAWFVSRSQKNHSYNTEALRKPPRLMHWI